MRRGFAGGLVSALAKGATAYSEQRTDDSRAMVALAAQRAREQRQLERQARQDELAESTAGNAQMNALAKLRADERDRAERRADRQAAEAARQRAEERAMRSEERAVAAASRAERTASRAERTASAGVDATNRAEHNLTLAKLEANRRDRQEAAARQKAASAAVPLEERSVPDRTKPKGPDGRYPEIPTETGTRFLSDSLAYDREVVRPLEDYRTILQRSLRSPGDTLPTPKPAPARDAAPAAAPAARAPNAAPSPAPAAAQASAPSVTSAKRVAPWNPAAADLAAEQADWDEAVRIHGKAKVEQVYGPRPR